MAFDVISIVYISIFVLSVLVGLKRGFLVCPPYIHTLLPFFHSCFFLFLLLFLFCYFSLFHFLFLAWFLVGSSLVPHLVPHFYPDKSLTVPVLSGFYGYFFVPQLVPHIWSILKFCPAYFVLFSASRIFPYC